MRFAEDGSGVVFSTDPAGADDFYWLATKAEGREGYVKVQDLKKPVLVHEGRSYDVVAGSSARLNIASDQWSKLIDKRHRVIGDPPERVSR